MSITWTVISLVVFATLAFQLASATVWTVSTLVLLTLYSYFMPASTLWLASIWGGFIVLALAFNKTPIRQKLLTARILKIALKSAPKMSETEKTALEAGTVGFEGGVFAGRTDWDSLLTMPHPDLHFSAEEQAFLDGPVAELCARIDDWQITHELADMPESIWAFIKTHGFLGMIIPKEYGGKDFSASAQAEILSRIGVYSNTVGTSIAVPNSLGPAELLLCYGTDEQKNYYLPRLASGEEIPCFALTGPEAGSDASSIPDSGVVERGVFNGKETLGVRLNWDKRYITLAPVATVMGLAFKLYDPNCLLSDEVERGITCALIPTNTPGIEIGRRHFPLNIAFQNGPIKGRDVFIPLEWIIGGADMIGQGWRMLMECLAAGRAISLPSTATAGSRLCAFSSIAYARIRKQFKQPIMNFEGVSEALTKIISNAYMIESMRSLTTSFIDQGEKPSVLSAMIKYHSTEMSRECFQHAMDVHGGKGICLGVDNYLGRSYQTVPIAVTVEGANILTRSLIIFGQGAVRCHPYALKEIQALANTNKYQQLQDFDAALFAHLGTVFANGIRSLLMGLTRGALQRTPSSAVKKHIRLFNYYSIAFSLLADVAMLSLGGRLKFMESLSGRLGDIFSYLYIGASVIKRFHAQGQQADDLDLVNWCCLSLQHRIEQQFKAIFSNWPNKVVATSLRVLCFPLGFCANGASDKLGKRVVKTFLKSKKTRQRLLNDMYVEHDNKHVLNDLALCLEKTLAVEPLEQRLYHAKKEGKLAAGATMQEANEAGIISAAEFDLYQETAALTKKIVAVNDFDPQDLAHNSIRDETSLNSATSSSAACPPKPGRRGAKAEDPVNAG